MNTTDDISSLFGICTTCQISYGFSSSDRRAMIILIVLTAVALISCYIAVLWFAIRTRFIADKNPLIMMENVATNQSYNHDEDEEENVQTINHKPTPATPPQIAVILENEAERF